MSGDMRRMSDGMSEEMAERVQEEMPERMSKDVQALASDKTMGPGPQKLVVRLASITQRGWCHGECFEMSWWGFAQKEIWFSLSICVLNWKYLHSSREDLKRNPLVQTSSVFFSGTNALHACELGGGRGAGGGAASESCRHAFCVPLHAPGILAEQLFQTKPE